MDVSYRSPAAIQGQCAAGDGHQKSAGCSLNVHLLGTTQAVMAVLIRVGILLRAELIAVEAKNV